MNFFSDVLNGSIFSGIEKLLQGILLELDMSAANKFKYQVIQKAIWGTARKYVTRVSLHENEQTIFCFNYQIGG